MCERTSPFSIYVSVSRQSHEGLIVVVRGRSQVYTVVGLSMSNIDNGYLTISAKNKYLFKLDFVENLRRKHSNEEQLILPYRNR